MNYNTFAKKCKCFLWIFSRLLHIFSVLHNLFCQNKPPTLQILIYRSVYVGRCPTPHKLLKKFDQNFACIGAYKLHVILSRVQRTRRKESELSLSAAWLAAYMFFSL